jgi:hypothetical protein
MKINLQKYHILKNIKYLLLNPYNYHYKEINNTHKFN